MNENTFQERAEKLTKDEILNWTSLSSKDQQIIKKLLNNSTKLLIGPRGSGKSQLMRWAYYSCFLDKHIDVLPIYVNFEKYLHLEPLLHETSNGNILFRKWILAKIIIETIPTLEECNIEYDIDKQIRNSFSISLNELEKVVYHFEGGTLTNKRLFWNRDEYDLSVGSVLEFIDQLLSTTNRNRAVLLLDDAAHAFSSNLQKEFFEVFRVLKTKKICAKAAVYPGLTSYSPYFNIGHDALYLEAGYSPEEEGYLEFCDDLLRKRLGDEVYSKLKSNEDGLDVLYYAANGIPRGIIVMSEYLDENCKAKKPNRFNYYEAIDVWVEIIEKFHSSLKTRLPRYKNFIDAGVEFTQIILNQLKEFNRDKPTDHKAVYFALSQPLPNELEKMINLLEYAGIVTEKKSISKGPKGTFTRYMVHLGKIIQTHTFGEGKAKTLSYEKDCLIRIKTKEFIRIQATRVFGRDLKKRCVLELPPCNNCKKERISEDARFCAYCGYELKSASILYEIMEQPIESLPLTSRRIESIKGQSKIRTIKDILMDENGNELKKVKGIQGYWAQKIKAYAEEFIGG